VDNEETGAISFSQIAPVSSLQAFSF